MLAAIEKGDESVKRFELSTLYVPEPNASVFRLAAAIPCGYVCTYGNIASIARTNARVVGRLMATNPLYPIVPCHRVVGADMKLVGYGGKTDEEALGAKLSRLRSETRGFTEKLELTEAGGLYIYPAEWVIAKSLVVETDQLTLW
jgi:methylated-DNA-[protein]-cysteine S-methyltransferase